MSVYQFLNRYYIKPVVEGTGYNIFNTLTYAALLILAAYLVLKILNKLDIDLDRSLWINILPFVLLGGFLRALEDVGLFSSLGMWNYLFITPLIYFLIFALAFIPLITVEYFDLSRSYLGLFGLSLLGLFSPFILINSQNPIYFSLALFVAISGCLSVYLIARYFGIEKFEDLMNWSPIFAHSLDSSATFVAVGVLGTYSEQHVLPSLLFNYVPIFLFVPIKLLISSLAVYYIDEIEGSYCWILKFVVLVLGLGPGTRNILTMLMGA